ncbi:MAG: hypothetical protein U7127_13405 [Phormidium sp.]
MLEKLKLHLRNPVSLNLQLHKIEEAALAQQRAREAEERAQKLAEQLRSLGINPEA